MELTDQEKQNIFAQYWLQVGDRVELKREPGNIGTIKKIDFDSYPFWNYGETTCVIQWDDNQEGDLDIQWTNKLYKVIEVVKVERR